MAKFNVVGLDDIMRQMNQRTAKAVRKVPKMLEAGAAVLIDAQKSEIDIMINESKVRQVGIPTRSLGDLKDSIKASKIKTDKEGHRYIEVFPHGKDSDGTSNAEKGFVLEYGWSDVPDGYPWMTIANAKAEERVMEAELEVWGDDSV